MRGKEIFVFYVLAAGAVVLLGLVLEPFHRSGAARTGLRPGDVVVEVNRQPARRLEDLKEVSDQMTGSVLLRTLRGFFALGA